MWKLIDVCDATDGGLRSLPFPLGRRLPGTKQFGTHTRQCTRMYCRDYVTQGRKMECTITLFVTDRLWPAQAELVVRVGVGGLLTLKISSLSVDPQPKIDRMSIRYRLHAVLRRTYVLGQSGVIPSLGMRRDLVDRGKPK